MTRPTKRPIGWLTLVVVVLVPARALPFGDDETTSTACGNGVRATCCFTVPDKDVTGDNFYGPGNWDWCRNDYTNALVNGFDMDDRWNGHGKNDRCNTDLPFGRFVTGFVALSETSPTKTWPNSHDRSGNLLQWGAGWVWDTVEEIVARCGGSNDGIAKCDSCCNFLGFGDFELLLFVPANFYSQFAEERASTLVHESRHWDGPCHDAGNNDSSWELDGAWHWEVAWLSWYAAEATPAPKGLRCNAQDQANSFLSGSFSKDPGFRIQAIDCD